ncbi:MAG: hypothetical protein LQ350_004668 [Teloschistes chrysophthalmus]|nr:MAG: hypothetical protein LQ350_004668 [Niorma chrysophthalma]
MPRLLRRKFNGEITDPPAQTFTPKRYVQPQAHSLLPEVSPPENSLFCQRCLQNQHIIHQALSEYLPSQDHPQYFEYERGLPGYRRKMEERYPQVCANCAPAIERQIRATGYAAKSDHLRRLMERNRGAGLRRPSWTWKSFLVSLGAMGWTMGLAVHLIWHLLGALPRLPVEDGLVDEDVSQSVLSCFFISALAPQSSPSCEQLLQPTLIYAFSMSLLCVWWNPKMQYKLRGGYGRIVGSVDFYKSQCIALILRFLSTTLTTKRYSFLQDQRTARALHALSLVIELLLAISSFRSIRIDQRPVVSFQENYEPLVPPQAQVPQQLPRRAVTPPPKYCIDDSFLRKLDPQPEETPYQPPTPPPEEDGITEDSMMDWTPEHNFRPAAAYQPLQSLSKPMFDGPSPFHGVLPPAPVSWAHRLRNPPNQPRFRKASEKKKESLFPAKKQKHAVSDAASDAASQFSPASKGDSRSDIGSPVRFADPKFFAPSDMNVTGLESLFGDTFSLGRDLTVDSSSIVPGQVPTGAATSALTPGPFFRLATAAVLGASCVVWDYASTILPTLAPQTRLLCLLVAASVSAFNLYASSVSFSGSVVIMSATSMAAAAYIGTTLYHTFDAEEEQDQLGAMGLWYLLATTVWEIWGFICSLATPSSDDEPPVVVPKSEPMPPRRQRPQPQSPLRPVQQPIKQRQLPNPMHEHTTTFSARAKPNVVVMSQRTTRSRSKSAAREKVPRGSLGAGMGNLSLDGWR